MLARLTNPFIFGGPVSAAKFIGRKEQVNIILSQLANPGSRGSSAISGEPRIGKTSLLHYIASPEAAKEYGLSHSQFAFVFVDTQALGSYMDSQNVDTFSETVFWHYILRHLSAYPIPGVEYSKELLEKRVGADDLRPLFGQVAAQSKLVVLLLDEFEWIIGNIAPQHPTLLDALRSLLNRPVSKRGLALVTSSEKPLSILCRDMKFAGSPFPNPLVPVHLGPFSTQEAHELIKGYLEGTGVSFTKDDVDFVTRFSGWHPYFLQYACFNLFEAYRGKKRISKVAREKAQQAAEERLQKLTLSEKSQLQEQIQELREEYEVFRDKASAQDAHYKEELAKTQAQLRSLSERLPVQYKEELAKTQAQLYSLSERLSMVSKQQSQSQRIVLVLALALIFATALALVRPWISGGLWWFVLTGLLLVLYISVLVAFRPMQKGRWGQTFIIGFPLLVLASLALPLGQGQVFFEVLGVVANIGGFMGLLLFVLAKD